MFTNVGFRMSCFGLRSKLTFSSCKSKIAVYAKACQIAEELRYPKVMVESDYKIAVDSVLGFS